MYVDRHKKSGDFWLIGSQMFRMMKNVSESLAGRVGIINLFGLSNSEISGTLFDRYTTEKDELLKRIYTAKPMTLPDVFEQIFKGGMPRIYEQPNVNQEEYYSSYVQTYLSRDIKELTQVADEMTFYKFLCIAAAHTGSMVNYDTLAKEAEISAPVMLYALPITCAQLTVKIGRFLFG